MKRNVGSAMALLALATGLCAPSPAQTSDKIEPAAMAALNGMGAYLRTLKVFQVEAQTTSEDVLVDGLKVQFAHTTNILARMPDRLLAQTDGDLRKRLYLYDGKNFTLFAMRAGYYATVPAPPTIVQLADVASKKYDVEIPLVDLFLWGGPHATTSQITVATDIGPADVGGITCEHYVFRQPGLDWQVWIQKGDFPLPKKMVLTTTTDEARPQHTSVLTWNLAPSFNDAAFTFDPPADAHRIVFAKESDQN